MGFNKYIKSAQSKINLIIPIQDLKQVSEWIVKERHGIENKE